MDTLEILKEHVWTRPTSYMGHSPDGDYCVISRNRDSQILDNANFQRFKEILESLDPDNQHWDTFTARHWAFGWVEYLMINKTAPDLILGAAASLLSSLADYPVIDDELYSQMVWDAQTDYWDKASIRERIELCLDDGVSIMKARHDCMPELPSFKESEMFY